MVYPYGMKKTHCGVAALALLPALLAAAELKLTDSGIAVASGSGLGALTLDYPLLTGGGGGGERRKPETVSVNGGTAALRYAGGAEIEAALSPEGTIRFHAKGLGADDKGLALNMPLPVSLAGKARWSIGDSTPQLLPAEKGPDAFLWRGNATRFTLTDEAGKGVSVVIEHGYQQLQDNRVWNTDAFQWLAFAALPRAGAGEAWYTVHVLDAGAPVPAPGAAPPAAKKPAPAKPAPSADSLAVSLAEKGADLACGGLGTFTLAYPQLDFGDGRKREPVETRVQGATATLAYEGGVAVTVSVSGGKIAYAFANAPAALEAFSTSLLIPPNFSEGGTWRAGSAGGAFPKEKPAKPHLYQDHARRFEFADINNRRLGFDLPEYTYVQVQDNREWNWNIFWIGFKVAYLPDRPVYEIDVALDGAAARRVVLVDRFGQTTRRDFPGKVGDEADLKKDAETEAAYYASLKPPARNRFGGLAGSGARLGLKKTGFFHVEQKTIGGRDVWILADPEGDAFFHLGVCTFGPGEDYTTVEKREDIYDWLPPRGGGFAAAWHPDKWWNPRAVSFYKANVVRKYGAYDAAAHTARLVERVRRLGFNSVGAFSPDSPVFAEQGFPRVATLPLGTWTLGPAVPGVRGVFDPFDEKTLAKIGDLFAKSVAPNADDPLLIGYFLDNEQAFEDLPRAIPALPGKHACKRELVARLQARYGEIAAFNTAWGLDAASFEALADRGLPVTTKAAFGDMQAYTEHFLETYYRSIVDALRKVDKNHMLIGNRWQPSTANSETLCRVAGKYMDVISVNYYTCGIDEAFVRRLYEWSGRRPQMWSEFYFTAAQESNVAAANNDLPTQRGRGLAYRHYVEGAAALGFVVGVEWFTLIDQAVTGRFFEGFNGERANTGLFNVADRPYRDLFAEMAKTHAAVYNVWLEGAAPFRFDEPRFSGKAGGAARTVSAGRAAGPMAIDGRLDGWPGRPPERLGADRLALGRESGGTEAAFKLCWDEKALYLLVNVTDPTPMKNAHSGADLWNADAVELFIGGEKPEQGGALLFTDRQILLGAGKDNQTHVVNAARQPVIETSVTPSVDGKGYTLEAAIPWSALDVAPKEGQTLLFDLALGNSADGKQRTSQLVWNGGPRNSSDRGGWGRLTLVP
jgi:hypothetical protein